MPKTGPIIIIEDDQEDQELLQDVLNALGVSNQLQFFNTADNVIDFLSSTRVHPFLVLCDINMPGINGLELRKTINKDAYIRNKSIPFVFYTTGSSKENVSKAYEMMVQGFFEKADKMDEMKKQLKVIIDYWKLCLHPNS